jgi:signal transduction histidine kinase
MEKVISVILRFQRRYGEDPKRITVIRNKRLNKMSGYIWSRGLQTPEQRRKELEKRFDRADEVRGRFQEV